MLACSVFNALRCLGVLWLLFLQRNILEDPTRGYLKDDTIIIKYTIELVVSTGGALSRNQHPNKGDLIKMPLPTLGRDLGELFRTGEGMGGRGGGRSHRSCLSAWEWQWRNVPVEWQWRNVPVCWTMFGAASGNTVIHCKRQICLLPLS